MIHSFKGFSINCKWKTFFFFFQLRWNLCTKPTEGFCLLLSTFNYHLFCWVCQRGYAKSSNYTVCNIICVNTKVCSSKGISFFHFHASNIILLFTMLEIMNTCTDKTMNEGILPWNLLFFYLVFEMFYMQLFINIL